MVHLDEVIEKLTQIRKSEGNLPVVKVGHYGKIIYEMDLIDFNTELAAGELEDVNGKPKEIKVLNVDTPDIGPEPD